MPVEGDLRLSGWGKVVSLRKGPPQVAAVAAWMCTMQAPGAQPLRSMLCVSRSEVCSSGFTDAEARVACRQLGYCCGVLSTYSATGPKMRKLRNTLGRGSCGHRPLGETALLLAARTYLACGLAVHRCRGQVGLVTSCCARL